MPFSFFGFVLHYDVQSKKGEVKKTKTLEAPNQFQLCQEFLYMLSYLTILSCNNSHYFKDENTESKSK